MSWSTQIIESNLSLPDNRWDEIANTLVKDLQKRHKEYNKTKHCERLVEIQKNLFLEFRVKEMLREFYEVCLTDTNTISTSNYDPDGFEPPEIRGYYLEDLLIVLAPFIKVGTFIQTKDQNGEESRVALARKKSPYVRTDAPRVTWPRLPGNNWGKNK